MSIKVLFDIFHPADVHFFKNSIKILVGRGDEVMVTSRNKDIVLDLLCQLGIKNREISRKGKGPIGLLLELFFRDFKLFKIAQSFKPDVYVGNNSPNVAHVAWLMRQPSLIFEDTEIHRLNHSIYNPFVTEVHSPDCYRLNLGLKHKVYPGYHALAYLHPNRFMPDPDIARRYIKHPEKKTVLIRFVDWGSIHDMGVAKLSNKDKIYIVKKIEEHALVLISSEVKLPTELEPNRISVFGDDIHQIICHADLVVGDSATMCSEASVLGTPSIYVDERGRGYTDELDAAYGLCFNFKPNQIDSALSKAIESLALDSTREYLKEKHKIMLSKKIDVSAYQVEQINRLAN
ncbi:MAG: DUF354 domain-containing protein [Deltaproteobacteria bacterium]|nr:DUF354 domain-containing protein [Deltaproteobacteria bacterium]